MQNSFYLIHHFLFVSRCISIYIFLVVNIIFVPCPINFSNFQKNQKFLEIRCATQTNTITKIESRSRLKLLQQKNQSVNQVYLILRKNRT